jgi:hypothetical protein
MSSAMQIHRTLGLLLVAGTMSGCWQHQSAGTRTLSVVRVSPDLGNAATPLLLNDAITVFFSAPVDALSVTRDTVEVLDAEGNAVPGRLRVGGTWVTFEPRAPLTQALEDGSFRPGREYRLVVAGFPRIDCVRGTDGSRLAAGVQRAFRTATRDAVPGGLPAPLRPVADPSVPFLVDVSGTGTLPADNARLRLRFSLPVLPASLGPDAFQVQLVRMSTGRVETPTELVPGDVRALGIDDFHCCTVELDLGTRLTDRRGAPVQLAPGDYVYVTFARGVAALRDYADRELQAPGMPIIFSVVEGAAAVVLRWPQWPHGDDNLLPAADVATPGFEFVNGVFRPLVRVEAGDGSLGVFRPTRDTTLEPGQPFDRGDGTRVASRGTVFPFLAIDVPAGVTVTIDARRAPVQLLALARAQVQGRIVIEGETGQPPPPGGIGDAATIQTSAAVSILAAGGIEIGPAPAAIVAASAQSVSVPLALVSAGPITVRGPIPFAILAAERSLRRGDSHVERCASVQVKLTPGLADGVEVEAQGLTAFQPLPPTIAAPLLRITDGDASVHVDWQSAPPQIDHPERPDPDPVRMTAFREAVDAQPLPVAPGSFLRLRLGARVRGGSPLPQVRELQLLDR